MPLELSIVIPVFNEAEILEESVGIVLGHASALGVPFELILVDDGSRDATWEIVQRLVAAQDRVRGAKLSRNFGKERAICAGLELARGRAVVVMDGDLQHPPEQLAPMLAQWREGKADIVRAVKLHRGKESRVYRWMSRLFYAAMAFLSGYDLEGASDFVLLDRKVVRVITGMSEQFPFFRGTVAWLGYRQAEVPFSVPDRLGGASRWSARSLVGYALSNMLAFSALPLRLVNYIGGGFLVLAVALGALTLYRWFSGSALEGFTTVIILLLVVGGAILVGLGIVGEYVGKIHEEVKRRPRYLIAEEVGGEARGER